MFCDKCGKEVKEGNAFCTECGAPVEKKPAAAEIQPSPPAPAAQPTPPPPAPGVPAFAAPPPLLPHKKKHIGLILGIVALALVIVAVVVVVVVLVFSSNTGQAKKLINKAAPLMTRLETQGTTLGTDLNTLLTGIGAMQSSAQYETEANKLRAQVTEINKELDQSMTYISQVQKLSGVADYKEFATVVSDLIRTDKKEMIQVTDYLNYLGQQFKDVEAGKTVDANVISQRTSEFVSKLKALGAQAEDLKAKAEKIKKDKNL
jgi:flagellar basal body-associated protein FliL